MTRLPLGAAGLPDLGQVSRQGISPQIILALLQQIQNISTVNLMNYIENRTKTAIEVLSVDGLPDEVRNKAEEVVVKWISNEPNIQEDPATNS